MKVITAIKQPLSKWGGKIPPNLKLPLRDGDIDRPEDEAYKGCYFFNANSRQAPQVVDKQVQPILDQTEVYSGCYGRISVNFYGYTPENKRNHTRKNNGEVQSYYISENHEPIVSPEVWEQVQKIREQRKRDRTTQ